MATLDPIKLVSAHRGAVGQPQQRFLQQNGGSGRQQSGRADGIVALTIMMLFIVCMAWIPSYIRRCRRRAEFEAEWNQRAGERLATILEAHSRAEVDILRRMMEEGSLFSSSALAQRRAGGSRLMMMSLEDRRDYIMNVLMTKHIILPPDRTEKGLERNQEIPTAEVSIDGNEQDAVAPTVERETQESSPASSSTNAEGEPETKSDVILQPRQPPRRNQEGEADGDDQQEEDDANEVAENTCAICLTEYEEGDEISWSHNRLCNHFFHRACIAEWLLFHDECPCCRMDFLSFNSDDEDDDDDDDDNLFSGRGRPLPVATPVPYGNNDDSDDEHNLAFVRGMQLFLQFANSQSMRGFNNASDHNNNSNRSHDDNHVEMATVTRGVETPTTTPTTTTTLAAEEAASDSSSSDAREVEDTSRPSTLSASAAATTTTTIPSSSLQETTNRAALAALVRVRMLMNQGRVD